MRRSATDKRGRRNLLLLIGILGTLTLINYGFYLKMSSSSATTADTDPPKIYIHPEPPRTKRPLTRKPVVVETKAPRTPQPPVEADIAAPVEDDPVGDDPPTDAPEQTLDAATDPPDAEINHKSYEEALEQFDANLKVKLPPNLALLNDKTDRYVDVNALPDHGVVLPHDPTKATAHLYVHCDPANTSFSWERDVQCQRYLSNVHNMRSIKALSSILDTGRTIKFKLYYHNNNLTAIVKVSQKKFFFESASEYLALLVDRVLELHRVPPTAYVALPIDFMRAASAVVSPFYSQWFDFFIPKYDYTKPNMVKCEGDRDKKCSLTAVQVWMFDVHGTVMSNLKLPYSKLDEHVVHKYYTPRSKHHWPPAPTRHFSISELCDRFIFDFLIGNTDRGMNDHNNFVYGGCDKTSDCHLKPLEHRTGYPAKYAFIDHGSSFHSHKEPEGNAFTGNKTEICRFRRSTFEKLQQFKRKPGMSAHKRPFIDAIKTKLPKGIFNVIRMSIFKKMQDRLDKIAAQAEHCIEKFSEEEVLSLLEHHPDGK